MSTHIVHYSGGVTSWECGMRVAKRYGWDNTFLLFADTRIEDEDNYRFLIQGAAVIFDIALGEVQSLVDRALALPLIEDGRTTERSASLELLSRDVMQAIPRLVWIADGRTPWQVFRDERFMGNSRVDPCSRVLKRELLDDFASRFTEHATHHFGFTPAEASRIENLSAMMSDRNIDFPLTWNPQIVLKSEIFSQIKSLGFKHPRLYDFGFKHANCGGFCCKMGQASADILRTYLPKRYAFHEGEEQSFREFIGKDVSMLTDRTGGEKKTLTLRQFRERQENGALFDGYDHGACSCFLPETAGAP